VNPSEKGWLRAFLTYHERRLREGAESSYMRWAEEAESSHQYLYRLIQPTGLMYGYPVRFIHEPHPRVQEWGEKDKIKILLAEGYLSAGLYFAYRSSGRLRNRSDALIEQLRNYHLDASRYRPVKSGRIGRRRDLIDQVEYVLDRSISYSYDWRNFWNSFFHNTLLFFDLILFTQWLEQRDLIASQSLKQLQLDLRLKMLRIIAAAAHADGSVSPEEQTLYQHFLASAHLPAPQKKQAMAYLREGVDLSDLTFDLFSSWLLKKYFLELAILTSWANRQISPAEEKFLQDLTRAMGLDQSELLRSTEAVTSFVMKHWREVHYLHIKQNYRIVSEQLIQRLRLLVRRNQRMIAQEIVESRELVWLLRQSTQRELSNEEREKVRDQLLDILRAIPAFTIFMLPLGAITLPILLRIIPKNVLFPSSFRPNEAHRRNAHSARHGSSLWPEGPNEEV
jgi:hypothetical protein